ncbi:NADH-quinone oxidoreductase subunit A [Marinobacterium aestuariivivens]|uniref:NADH-quinone oxidoreductase subunit A n=1 Tax=Marinobacterium aestuariivivens TaxID=1698799 RepID=A0ABW1ZYK7_9GAMM
MYAMDMTTEQFWSMTFYTLAVLLLIAMMLMLSHLLGQQRHDRATDEPFESGIVSVGSGRLRLSIGYFVIAILFVIFDLEVIFLYAWAVAFETVGVAGFIEALVFILILLAALAYLWREGALDWGPRQRSLAPRERGQ